MNGWGPEDSEDSDAVGLTSVRFGKREREREQVAIRVQGWAKERALGCVNSRPVARGIQEAGFTRPRAHVLADPCIRTSRAPRRRRKSDLPPFLPSLAAAIIHNIPPGRKDLAGMIVLVGAMKV